jgi:hypothetical protein
MKKVKNSLLSKIVGSQLPFIHHYGENRRFQKALYMVYLNDKKLGNAPHPSFHST